MTFLSSVCQSTNEMLSQDQVSRSETFEPFLIYLHLKHPIKKSHAYIGT